MTKLFLISSLATQMGMTKKLTGEFVNRFLKLIIKGVRRDGEVSMQGFGSFKKSRRKAREGINPQNPSQRIVIPAMCVVNFKAGNKFKKAVK